GAAPELSDISSFLKDQNPQLRAHAVWLCGVNRFEKSVPQLEDALGDKDAMVRRRACEALIRIEHEPPIAKLWPLLGDKDRFVRHAARLVLERIDSKKYADKIWKEPNDLIAWNGIIALCHTDQAQPYAEQIFGRLRALQSLKA